MWILNYGTLFEQVPSISNLNLDCPLSYMVTDDDSWNLELFHLRISKEVISRIIDVPPPHPSFGPDKIIWHGTTTGSFSLKSAYGKLLEGALNSKEPIWQFLWKFQGPQQIRFFIWLTLKQRLLTNAKRVPIVNY